MKSIVILFLIFVVTHELNAGEFITIKDDKIGVNFGGYHAAVGLGGLLGGGVKGGLYAEAGTPFGQSASAGLGGTVDKEGKPAGALYAGATAGGGIKASAGLGGSVTGDKAGGVGVASAQAGGHYASHLLTGESTVEGAVKPVVVLTENKNDEQLSVKPVHKKVHVEFDFDAANGIKSVPVTSEVQYDVQTEIIPEGRTYVKEITYVKTPVIKEKHIHRTHYKPSRHHLRKTAYIGGYVGSDIGVEYPQPPPPPPKHVIVETVQPVINKRVDVAIDSAAESNVNTHVQHGHDTDITYKKEVTFQRNPSFFADIFNIPIATLKAVGDLVGNAAKGTSISVQKSASVHTDADSLTPHRLPTSSLSSSSDGHISIETPSASNIFDDILSIPINTLGAVSKFLENNIPAKKRVEVSQDGAGEPTRIRLGPHARRRANKVVITEELESPSQTEST